MGRLGVAVVAVVGLLVVSGCPPRDATPDAGDADAQSPHSKLCGDFSGTPARDAGVEGDARETGSSRNRRLDPYQLDDADRKRRWARATAVLVSTDQIEETAGGDGYRLDAYCYGTSFDLCANEPFRSQPTAGYCSSFLVAPRYVVTAGHCLKDQTCSDLRFVFDYGYYRRDQNPTRIDGDDMYRCDEILAQKVEGFLRGSDSDYGVVRLRRPVEGREPLTVAAAGELDPEDRLAMVGYPKGLPVKISLGGEVVSLFGNRFRASLESYGGNSGGPVIDRASGSVVGLVSSGSKTKFVEANGENCRRHRQCETFRTSSESCKGVNVLGSADWKPVVDRAIPGSGADAGSGDTGVGPGDASLDGGPGSDGG